MSIQNPLVRHACLNYNKLVLIDSRIVSVLPGPIPGLGNFSDARFGQRRFFRVSRTSYGPAKALKRIQGQVSQ